MTGPALRSVRLPDPAAVESDPDLLERIRGEIRASGPMTFARFMELALYDPERGYYATSAARTSREGDFLTAPETHPIFGATIARQLAEVWQLLGRPDPFVVREDGAGSGALAIAILDGLAASGSPLREAIRYRPVEANADRLARVRARIAEATRPEVLDDGNGPFVGTVLANELLDALPVHRVVGTATGIKELFVTLAEDGSFVDTAGSPSTPLLADRLAGEGVTLAVGQRGEVCLALDGWVAEVSAALLRGVAIVIDYGHPATDLYDASLRPGGTLRAYLGHSVHADPYHAIARQDLTAHVDLTALERSARANSLDVLGITSQAEFLVGAGMEQLLATARQAPETDMATQLALRSAVGRLLDPRHMGGFRVAVLGRGLSADARISGLSFRLRA